jgi:hypothetical protein
VRPKCADCPFQGPCSLGCTIQAVVPPPYESEDYDLIRLGDPEWEENELDWPRMASEEDADEPGTFYLNVYDTLDDFDDGFDDIPWPDASDDDSTDYDR